MTQYKFFIVGFLFILTLLCGNQTLAQAPYISSLDKPSGKIGETVTITGFNFSNNAAGLQVNFGSVKAVISTASPNLLEVIVPAGATYDKISVTNKNTRLTGYSIIPFYINFGGAKNNISAFETEALFPTGTNTYDLCLCDFDNDGLSDIAVSNNGSNEILVYKNNSTVTNLTLSKATDSDLNIGFPTININCADLNGDGKAELIATQGGSSNNGVFVFKNESTGSGNFSFTRIGSNAALPDFSLPNDSNGNIRAARRIETNDMDLDGKPEIIISSSSGNIVDVFKNTSASGNVSFNSVPVQTTVPGLTISSGLDVKDLNNDGLPEIALVDDKNSNIYVINNRSELGSIIFGGITVETVSGGFQNLRIGDINNDGFNDLVITDRINSRISVLENQTSTIGGTINLSSVTTISDGINQPWGLDLGDLDGDGSLDIAISSTNTSGSNIQLLLGDDPANFTFLPTSTISTTSNSRNIKIGDLNGDGKPDISLTHKVSGIGDLSVFINRNCVSPIVTPIGETEICTGQTLILKATKSGGAIYTWDQDVDKDGVFELINTKSGSDNTLDASANGTGNYRLTISDGLGCTEFSNIVDITVTSSGITAPTASSVPAEGTINCEGVDIQLSATSDASITSYEWSGPNNYSSTDQTPLLSAATAEMTGRYSVIGRNADGCISETAELLVVVESLPVIAVKNNDGIDTFCTGSSATVSVTDFGTNYSYQWEKDGIGITGQSETNLSITESGNYTAIITSISNGCSHESLPRTLTTIPVPTNSINSLDLVCEDLTLVFTAPSSDQNGLAVSHDWDFGNGTTTSGSEVSNTYADPGTYTVSLTTSYTELTSCTNNVLTKDITVQGVPNTANGSTVSISTSTGSTEKCPSESIDLTVPGDYTNYSWYRDVGTELSNTNSLTEVSEPERDDAAVTYFLSATDAAGCNFSTDIEISLKANAGIFLTTLEATRFNSTTGETEIDLEEGRLSLDLSVTGTASNIFWSPEEIFNTPDESDVTVIPNDVSILVKVSGIDTAGCLESDSIRILSPYLAIIKTFSVPQQTKGATIDVVNRTIDIEVEPGTDLSSLVSTFELSLGATIKIGSIVQESGVLANDFTNPVSYTIITESGTIQNWVVTVVVKNNEIPIISGALFIVNENSETGLLIGQVLASDPENDHLSYSIISGNTNDAFSIDANTGTIRVNNKSALDYETTPTFNLGIEVQDDKGGIATAQIIINLNDLEEQENIGPTIDDQSFDIDENSLEGVSVGFIMAKDPDAIQLFFSIISGNEKGAFLLDELSGELLVDDSEPLDFEKNPKFTIVVQVSDGELTHLAIITVDINDLEDDVVAGIEINPNIPVVYPNPVENKLTIEWEGFKSATIFDLSGRVVSKFTVSELSLQNLSSGMYFLRLSNKTHEQIQISIVKN